MSFPGFASPSDPQASKRTINGDHSRLPGRRGIDRRNMRPAAAFGKPFTYLAAAPPSSPAAAADHRQPQQHQTPVPASVLHTFAAPTPPVRTSTTTAGKQKPPPVPPRGEQTRLTTVLPKKPVERVPVVTAPSPPPPPPPPPRTLSPPQLTVFPEDAAPLPPPPPVTAEPDEDLSASALISKFENAVKPLAIVTPVDQKPAAVEVDSGTSTLAECTDDDENNDGVGEEDGEDDGAADIWVRTIESPVKNTHPHKVRHHSDSAIKVAMNKSPPPLIEKRGSLPSDAAVTTAVTVQEKKSSPPLQTKRDPTRFSLRPAASDRCSSPATTAVNSSQQQQQQNKSLSLSEGGGAGRKISAAEALGVVAKPCPRILPSSASLDAACRRQSLGNLTESRFGTLLSSSIRSSWAPPSGVQTDVESTQSEPSSDYRRKKFTKRCSSADGRNPVHHHHHHHHYHTMSSSGRMAAAARDPDFGAKRAFIQEKLQAASVKLQNSGIVPSGLPPTPPPPLAYQLQLQNGGGGGDCSRPSRSSSCNCGQHQATSRPMFVNKRTVSAEDLFPSQAAVGTSCTGTDADHFSGASRTVSTSSSSSSGGGGGGRGSFGRSQRVTFALDQHQLQFAGGRPTGAAEPPNSSVAKKPIKSNLKVKDTVACCNNTAVPELNMLGTSAVNTRLPPQHPHPYGLPYKLPAVTADVLQVVQNNISLFHYRC